LLYYQIDIESSEEKLDKKNMENPYKDIKKDINNITSDKKYFERFLFLEDRDIYMIDYKGIPMIFQKNKGLFYSNLRPNFYLKKVVEDMQLLLLMLM